MRIDESVTNARLAFISLSHFFSVSFSHSHFFFQSEWPKINLLLYFQWLKDYSDNIPIFIDVWIVLLTWYFKKYPSFGGTILSVADLYDLRLFRLKTRLIQMIPEKLLCTKLLPSIVPSFVSEIIYYSGFLIESLEKISWEQALQQTQEMGRKETRIHMLLSLTLGKL